MSETTSKLDTDARYRVKGWNGIAFFIHGFPKRWEPDTILVEDSETGQEHEEDTGEGEWVEQTEACGRVIVVMVGDDSKHEVDVEDLTPLRRSEYCGSCGQVGCGHDAPDEDD